MNMPAAQFLGIAALLLAIVLAFALIVWAGAAIAEHWFGISRWWGAVLALPTAWGIYAFLAWLEPFRVQ